jgi:ankyrin repeat protein
MVSKPHQTPDATDASPTPKRLPLSAFLQAVWNGDIETVQAWMEDHVDIFNQVDDRTGMNGLHISVGRGHLEMVKMLVEAGAAFVPDGEGRMPSVIAAEIEVSEELADYICEAESRALQAHRQEDV